MLGRMHEALQGIVLDAVKNFGEGRPDLPEAYGGRFEALQKLLQELAEKSHSLHR